MNVTHKTIPPLQIAHQVVVLNSCVAALYDRCSPFNVPDFWPEIERHADARTREHPSEERWRFVMSEKDQRMQGTDILRWELLLHGVFKTELRLLPEHPQVEFEEHDANFWHSDSKMLSCPSGDLIVAGEDDLGREGLASIMSVPPGLYKADLVCDWDLINPGHYCLEAVSDYPADDEPDWIITLQRRGPLNALSGV